MRAYRIRVYGKQRTHIDRALLAQVLIVVGRDVHQRRLQRHAGGNDLEPAP